MKVLILGAASVQLDAVLELKELGCETYVAAMAKDGPAADAADHFDAINILDEASLAAHIREHGIDAVYSTGSDLAMPVACRLSEKLGLPHFVSSRTAYICNHKNVMRTTLGPDCKGNIPFQVMSEPENVDIGFPAIMKPSDSQGQRGIFLVNSYDEIAAHFEEVRSFSREKKVIVEKYIDGPEVSVNGYMINSVLRFTAVSDRETWPQYTGLIHKHIVPGSSFSPTVRPLIKEVAEDACNRVGILNGPVYFQMKIAGGRPYIIEMTPRLDGCHMWKLLLHASGMDLMRLTFSHLLKNDVSEIDKFNDGKVEKMELVFFCQEPHTTVDTERLVTPDDAVAHFYYYKTGDTVRPVNGKFEKIGYYIRKI